MNILVIDIVKERHIKKLKECFPKDDFVFTTKKELKDYQIESSEIIFGQIPPEKINQFTNIKWIQFPFAGFDPYVGKGIRKDVLLSSSVGAYNLVLAEYVIGAIFILQRKFNLYFLNQRKSIWKDMGPIQSVSQSNALIIGLGSAGSTLAKKLYALGCKVDGIRRTKGLKIEGVNNIYGPEELNSIIGNYNIIVITIPGSKETTYMINEDNLSLCRQDAIIVNVGRGYVIDNMALAKAVEKNNIFGCALDVTDPEPLPKNHPLWKMDNVIITPHVAGGLQLGSTRDAVVDIFIDNLPRYKKGQALVNPIKEF